MISTNIIVLAGNKQPLGAIESFTIKEKITENESAGAKLEITRMRIARDRSNDTFEDSKFLVASQKYPIHIVILDDKIETMRATNVWLTAIAVTYTTDEWIIAEGVEAECESVSSNRTYKSSVD